MKPVLITILATLASGIAAMAPARAQAPEALIQPVQFGGGYYYEERQPRVYRERRVYRDYDDEEFEQRPRRRAYGEGGFYGQPQRRAQGFGQVCVTSRGQCYVNPQPISSRCGCQIPGFGPKRGNVAY
jgi:hypothetical protein